MVFWQQDILHILFHDCISNGMKMLNGKEVVEKSREIWGASGFCQKLFAWKNFFQAEDRGDSTVPKQIAVWASGSWCDPLNPHKKRQGLSAVHWHSQQWRGRDKWASGAHHGPACSVSVCTNQPAQWTPEPACLPALSVNHAPGCQSDQRAPVATARLLSRVQASEASNKTKQNKSKRKSDSYCKFCICILTIIYF